MLKIQLPNLLKTIACELEVVPPDPAAQKDEIRKSLPPFLQLFEDKYPPDEIEQIIERDAEVEATLGALASDSNGNAMLLGFHGTGKTAIAKEITRQIHTGDIDAKEIIGVEEGEVMMLYLNAGTFLGGGGLSVAEKVAILEGLLRRPEFANAIIFVDEAHLLGKVDPRVNSSAAELMKDLLNQPQSHFVFATTVDEYRKDLKVITALGRRWQIVTVVETSPESTKMIVRRHRSTLLDKPRYRKLAYAIIVADELIDYIVDLAIRYIDPSQLAEAGYNPSRSIALLERALARLRTRNATLTSRFSGICRALEDGFNEYLGALYRKAPQRNLEGLQAFLRKNLQRFLDLQEEQRTAEAGVLTRDDVHTAAARITQLDKATFERMDIDALDGLEERLKGRVIGQDIPVEAVASRVRTAKLGFADPDKPLAAAIFAGPTGVGKTELAKALAAEVYGDPKAMVSIKGENFMQSHELQKLTGAPPGYIGYGDPAKFDEVIQRRSGCVILVDEFEKMHPDAQKVFLHVLDEGNTDMSDGKNVDCRQCIVIFTSNLGSEKLTTVKMETTTDELKQLHAFRRETISQLEQTTTTLDTQARTLSKAAEFDQAQKVEKRARAIRKFVATQQEDLERGVFPQEESTIPEEVREELALRQKEDAELREAFAKGGSFKYKRLLRIHRQKAQARVDQELENLRAEQQKLAGEIGKLETTLEELTDGNGRKAELEDKKDRLTREKALVDQQFLELAEMFGEVFDMADGNYARNMLPSGELALTELEEALKRFEEEDQTLAGQLKEARSGDEERGKAQDENQRIIEAEFRQFYSPEFLGRFKGTGGLYVFNSMNRAMADAITRKKIRETCQEQARMHGCEIEVAPEVYDFLLARSGQHSESGGRGIEAVLLEHFRTPLQQAIVASGRRTNLNVIVTVEGGGAANKIDFDVIPLAEEEETGLPEKIQEGEAGALLGRLHDEAEGIVEAFSGFAISRAQIEAFLLDPANTHFVNRGTALEFAATERLNCSGVLDNIGEWGEPPISQVMEFVPEHLEASGGDRAFCTAAQGVVQGLTLMAAKTLFSHLVATRLNNPRDTYDTLREKAEGNGGATSEQIDRVKRLGAAAETRFTWDVSDGQARFQVSVPCKLTNREIDLVTLYSERATADPAEIQQAIEDGKAQGLTVDAALLKSLGELRKRSGTGARIGFHIAGGEVHYWLRTRVVRPQADQAAERDADAADQTGQAEAFDANRASNSSYLGEFIAANREEWDRLSEERLLEIVSNDDLTGNEGGLIGRIARRLEDEARLVDEEDCDGPAEMAEEMGEYVEIAMGAMTSKGNAGLLTSPSFNIIMLHALSALQVNLDGVEFDFTRRYQQAVDQYRFRTQLAEAASAIEPRDQDAATAQAAIDDLRRRSAIDYEQMEQEAFDQAVANTTLLPQIASNAWVCQLLQMEEARITPELVEDGRISFSVQVGRYQGTFEFAIENTADQAKTLGALEARVAKVIASLDVLPDQVEVDPDVVDAARAVIGDINGSPYAGRFTNQLLDRTPLSGSPMETFQQSLRARLSGQEDQAGGQTGPLDFRRSAAAIRTFLTKLASNLGASTPAERPYPAAELADDYRVLAANGDGLLAMSLHAFLGRKDVFKGEARQAHLGEIRDAIGELGALTVATPYATLDSLLGIHFTSFQETAQARFFSFAFGQLIRQISEGDGVRETNIGQIFDKASRDSAFRDNVLVPNLNNLRRADKAYAEELEPTVSAARSIQGAIEGIEGRPRETLWRWFIEEVDRAIEMVDSPERGERLGSLLEEIGNASWVGETELLGLAAASTGLILRMDSEQQRLSGEIAEGAPEFGPLTRSPNRFGLYRGSRSGRAQTVPSEAIDTIDYLERNRDAMPAIMEILNTVAAGGTDPFIMVRNPGAGRIANMSTSISGNPPQSLSDLLGRSDFFSNAGGAAILVAVVEKGAERSLYVSVSGKDRYVGYWGFEAPLPS